MYIAGVDEVGRGPLAGPVVAAAVIISSPILGVTDSKKLTASKREELAIIIRSTAIAFALGRAEVEEIDALNIHNATLLAMKRAIEALSIQPDKVLVDGIHKPRVSMPCEAIIKGDALIFEIGAASILAKVARDAEMYALDLLYPDYGFAIHKGYPTAMHRQAIKDKGVCPIHRRSYAPVAASLARVK